MLLFVSREPHRTWWWVAAIAVAMSGATLILAFAERLQRWLGERVTVAFERLMGLILAAIAVELMLRGVRQFVASF